MLPLRSETEIIIDKPEFYTSHEKLEFAYKEKVMPAASS